MLLFRSEEHVDRWSSRWRQPRGGSLTLEQIWGLAQAWYAWDRRDPAWRRRTPEEVRALFDSLGLKGEFWALG
jgi:hypothetical protein